MSSETLDERFHADLAAYAKANPDSLDDDGNLLPPSQDEFSLEWAWKQLRKAESELSRLQQENEGIKRERDKFRRALDNHLCKYDVLDWIGCAGGHNPEYCICCETDKPHEHQILARAESAERELKALREQMRKVLPQVSQVFDGWHADGTAWSEWDESVRKEVSDLMRKVEP